MGQGHTSEDQTIRGVHGFATREALQSCPLSSGLISSAVNSLALRGWASIWPPTSLLNMALDSSNWHILSYFLGIFPDSNAHRPSCDPKTDEQICPGISGSLSQPNWKSHYLKANSEIIWFNPSYFYICKNRCPGR